MQIIFQEHFFRTKPEFMLVDLVKLKQYPGKTGKQYLDRFIEARGKCCSRIPEKEFVTIAHEGLEWELREKFKTHIHTYIFIYMSLG